MYSILLLAAILRHGHAAPVQAIGLTSSPMTAIGQPKVPARTSLSSVGPVTGLGGAVFSGSAKRGMAKMSVSNNDGKVVVTQVGDKTVMHLRGHELGPFVLKDAVIAFTPQGATYNLDHISDGKIGETMSFSNVAVLMNYGIKDGDDKTKNGGTLCVRSEKGKEIKAESLIGEKEINGQTVDQMHSLSLALPLNIHAQGGTLGAMVASVPEPMRPFAQTMVNKLLEVVLSQALKSVWNKNQVQFSQGKNVVADLKDTFPENSGFKPEVDKDSCPMKKPQA